MLTIQKRESTHHPESDIGGDVGCDKDERGGSEAPRRLHPHTNCATLTPPPSIQPSDVACEQQEAGTEAFNYIPPRIGVRAPPSRVRIEDKEHQFYELNLAWRSTTCGGCPKNRCTQTDFPCLLSHALPKPNTLFWPIQSMSNYIALNSQDQNISESGNHIREGVN